MIISSSFCLAALDFGLSIKSLVSSRFYPNIVSCKRNFVSAKFTENKSFTIQWNELKVKWMVDPSLGCRLVVDLHHARVDLFPMFDGIVSTGSYDIFLLKKVPSYNFNFDIILLKEDISMKFLQRRSNDRRTSTLLSIFIYLNFDQWLSFIAINIYWESYRIL